MNVIAIDLGGTKLAAAIFRKTGELVRQSTFELAGRKGKEVCDIILSAIKDLKYFAQENKQPISAVGISIPGIYYADNGRVWAPNIPGWDDYPLLNELTSIEELKNIRIKIDSDRACYILGETWQGAAQGSKNAIFIAVGTGIGAGILIDGKILRGHNDIAGAIGWLALERPFQQKYKSFGCFEYQASGTGLARLAGELIRETKNYSGVLSKVKSDQITGRNVFAAYEQKDPIAIKVIENAISLWAMATANLVSLFDPEMIIFGGGVFGPATQFIDRIQAESELWAQPISFIKVKIIASKLGGDAGLYGAGQLALSELI